MNAEFTPTRTRISTDRCQKMVAAGVLTKYDRIEADTVAPQVFPDVKIVVGEIFG
jgi:hypothetical protein